MKPPESGLAAGTRMFVIGNTNDKVYQYSLSTAYDVSTISFTQSFDFSARDNRPKGISFKSDGTRMYIAGFQNDKIYEYSLSTPWDVSTASFVDDFDISANTDNVAGVFLRRDGTRMYLTEEGKSQLVTEYSLSTAWDITTASFVDDFDVGSEESEPDGVFFKPDGTRMYVTGPGSDKVHEYSLSTPWDVTTASFVDDFDASAQSSFKRGLYFKPDGTKMYVAEDEYSLSTAWDVSTASYVQNFDLSPQDSSLQGIAFNE